ncbi:amino acid permease [Streptomyces sp. 3MP-14]|uniref:Amino acid permease n=1 Tax=Streptomyces mimosae TaxID=2586635 RepID=A0A5N6A659_9ACTN|nr:MULTISPECIES: amino acid permease [Streptomyces]KAB8164287.1 amino acid permease [Streptomyces mimosae]KAB8176564.1 amino acid permease [Streptomyces sp. 3MP-14]
MTGESSEVGASGGRLGVLQGTALYVGAVLGTGVIALPALAAEAAGPASLLAWLALVLLSAPLAGAFAALGARHPDAGGVSTYARIAFGERAAVVVGWCFFFAIPPGATAAVLFFGDYGSAALNGGATHSAGAAVALMVAVVAANTVGLRLTGRLQLVLAALLAVLLLCSVLLSLPDMRWENLQPFAPHGWAAIGSAATLLVWSFAGWEAITHLAGEFRHPSRDLPRAAAAAVLVVGLLYLSVAFAVVTVLGAGAARSDAPLGDLMARGLGGPAQTLAALAALLLTFGVVNTYLASAANLGAALARDGALPAALSRGGAAGEVPRRSLAVVATLALLLLGVVLGVGIGPKPLVLMTTGMFVTVYAVGVAAALRLLPRRSAGWWSALVSLVAVSALALMTGPYLLWPGVVALAALGYHRRAGRDRRAASEGGGPLPGRRVTGERAPEIDREPV